MQNAELNKKSGTLQIKACIKIKKKGLQILVIFKLENKISPV